MRPLAVTVLVASLAVPAAASAAPGPPLREDPAALAAALECSPGVATAADPPVVLVHGTTSSPEDSWSWGYRKVLPERGRPACTVRLPGRATVDLQRSAEYVVHAVRTVAARAPGHRVAVVGHSQGAFHAVFTAKFWPDVAAAIDDAVVLAGPFREAEGVQLGCNALTCAPPFRQRQKGARFFGGFLAAPLPAGPSFTSILTLQDEITRPQPASSTLTGPAGTSVRTITLQDVCPGRGTEHLGLLGDAVVFQLVLDALTHPGPADPARIAPDCAAERFPGADGAGYAAAMARGIAGIAAGAATADRSPAEPPVRCYVQPACADVAERGALLTGARVRAAGRAGRPRRIVLAVQAPGVVRITVARHGRRLTRTVRRVTPGERTVTLPRAASVGAGRHDVLVETRPAPYSAYAPERRTAFRTAA